MPVSLDWSADEFSDKECNYRKSGLHQSKCLVTSICDVGGDGGFPSGPRSVVLILTISVGWSEANVVEPSCQNLYTSIILIVFPVHDVIQVFSSSMARFILRPLQYRLWVSWILEVITACVISQPFCFISSPPRHLHRPYPSSSPLLPFSFRSDPSFSTPSSLLSLLLRTS